MKTGQRLNRMPRKQTGIRIPMDLYLRMERVADHQRGSVASVVSQCVASYLPQIERLYGGGEVNPLPPADVPRDGRRKGSKRPFECPTISEGRGDSSAVEIVGGRSPRPLMAHNGIVGVAGSNPVGSTSGRGSSSTEGLRESLRSSDVVSKLLSHTPLPDLPEDRDVVGRSVQSGPSPGAGFPGAGRRRQTMSHVENPHGAPSDVPAQPAAILGAIRRRVRNAGHRVSDCGRFVDLVLWAE